MMPTGRLLPRNEGLATAPYPSCVDTSRDVDLSVWDPLSDDFLIPPGIPETPRGLAVFFINRLRTRFDYRGNPWTSPWPLGAHLRLAKALLEEAGYRNAVRSIVYAIGIAHHRPSFAFVLRCAREKFNNARELDCRS